MALLQVLIVSVVLFMVLAVLTQRTSDHLDVARAVIARQQAYTACREAMDEALLTLLTDTRRPRPGSEGMPGEWNLRGKYFRWRSVWLSVQDHSGLIFIGNEPGPALDQVLQAEGWTLGDILDFRRALGRTYARDERALQSLEELRFYLPTDVYDRLPLSRMTMLGLGTLDPARMPNDADLRALLPPFIVDELLAMRATGEPLDGLRPRITEYAEFPVEGQPGFVYRLACAAFRDGARVHRVEDVRLRAGDPPWEWLGAPGPRITSALREGISEWR